MVKEEQNDGDQVITRSPDKLELQPTQNNCQLTNNDDLASRSPTCDDPELPNDRWNNQCDFFLSVLGYAVDLANVWRFPYVCYKNGGGAFLIPYFTIMALCALPVFYLEMILGQKWRRGAIAVWENMLPLFRGVGVAQLLISYEVAFYYNTVSAWALYFLIDSVGESLPWIGCDRTRGNTPNCIPMSDVANASGNAISSVFSSNASLASTEYFERIVFKLQNSGGIGDLGQIRWRIVFCLAVIFLLLFLSLRNGIKSSGKVVYVTAIAPYILLTALLINGLTLDGSQAGVKFFITPRFEELTQFGVWAQAAIQIFFSTGAGFGAHIAMASHNPTNYNCYRDCIIISVVNSFTSLLAGFTIFSYLGYLSVLLRTQIETVLSHGPGLVFQIYPVALSMLPLPSFWNVIFFALLIMLGLDSGMGGMGAVITGLTDILPARFKRFKHIRLIVTSIIVWSAAIVSLLGATNGGIYIFNLMDAYIAGASLLIGSLCQVIGVTWFYGMDRLCQDVRSMSLPSPSLYWRLCWKFITPLLLIFIVVGWFADPSPLQYEYGTWHDELVNITHNKTGDRLVQFYDYPGWARSVGWLLAIHTILLIPLIGLVEFVRRRLKGEKTKMIDIRTLFSIGSTSTHDGTLHCQQQGVAEYQLNDEQSPGDATEHHPVTQRSWLPRGLICCQCPHHGDADLEGRRDDGQTNL